MNETNPQRTPIPVELAPEHAQRIRVATEAFQGVAAATLKSAGVEQQTDQAEADAQPMNEHLIEMPEHIKPRQ